MEPTRTLQKFLDGKLVVDLRSSYGNGNTLDIEQVSFFFKILADYDLVWTTGDPASTYPYDLAALTRFPLIYHQQFRDNRYLISTENPSALCNICSVNFVRVHDFIRRCVREAHVLIEGKEPWRGIPLDLSAIYPE